jgi:hypothetical protein
VSKGCRVTSEGISEHKIVLSEIGGHIQRLSFKRLVKIYYGDNIMIFDADEIT